MFFVPASSTPPPTQQLNPFHLLTLLSWGACSPPSLLSLQVFLIADWAHAIGAGVTIETASHSAKHRYLRLIGLLSHILTEGVRGGGRGWSWKWDRKVNPNIKSYCCSIAPFFMTIWAWEESQVKNIQNITCNSQVVILDLICWRAALIKQARDVLWWL